MNVLVIGASSFTGRYFCDYVQNLGYEVYKQSLDDALHKLVQADYVVNFAAINVVAPSWEDPAKYMEVNALKLTKLTHFMNMARPKRYVHISTPEVYGSTEGYITEDHPYNPSTPYAVSRAAAEMMLKCYHKQYRFPVVFTRGCNVYGPGQQLYRLIPKLIESIRRGDRFPLEGGGTSVRAFCHVRDVCRGIWTVANDGEVGSAYHISSRTYAIKDIVSLICNKMNVDMADVVELVPERPGKDQAYLLDDSKLRALGWEPTISLEQGIEEMICVPA